MDFKLTDRLDEFGITRLADTTGLDTLGIPTASATLPLTTDVIWVYSGKGLTKENAQNCAIMEALERTSALWPTDSKKNDEILWLTENQMVETYGDNNVLKLRYHTEVPPQKNDSDAVVPWILVDSYRNKNQKTWICADFVFCGSRPDRYRKIIPPYPVSTSNGLGAAVSKEKALSHALLELAERDIVSMHEIAASHGGINLLASIADQAKISKDLIISNYKDHYKDIVYVDIETLELPEILRSSIKKLNNINIFALPNDFNIPCFVATAEQQVKLGTYQRCQGAAASYDSHTALVKSLLELAQTRATDFQGAREDRTDEEKKRYNSNQKSMWIDIDTGKPVPWEAINKNANFVELEKIDDIVNRFADVGLDKIFVKWFNNYKDVWSVRVIVPGIETWHATGGEGNWGPRARIKLGDKNKW